MNRKLSAPVLAVAAISRAGCGYSPGSRALSGGAITGSVTSPNTVSLGRPMVGN